MTAATLTVYGQPAPQGSKSAFVRGGRAVVVEGKGAGRASHVAWRQAVATAARDWQAESGQPLMDGPLRVLIVFVLHRPPSVPKKRHYPTTRPDLDKLTRSVLDALTHVIITDDSRVVDLHVVKRYATADEPPQARIMVEELP